MVRRYVVPNNVNGGVQSVESAESVDTELDSVVAEGEVETSPSTPPAPVKRGRGRPRGKKSDAKPGAQVAGRDTKTSAAQAQRDAPKRTSGRRTLSADVRAKGQLVRRQRSVFNRYLKSLGGSRASNKLDAINAELERGTRVRLVPLFEDGKRVGSVEKEVALLPSERARLLVKKKQLKLSGKIIVDTELRNEFL